MERGDIGPALLYQIQKKNEATMGVLKDLEQLDDKLENP